VIDPGATFGDVVPSTFRDARPSCRAFLYVVTAAFLLVPASAPVLRMVSQEKSNKESGYGSCFRVGNAEFGEQNLDYTRSIRAFG
jgi:hypothetical protein